jgi:7-keto-8-aminopelargonate synthetase-like enzyme
MKTRNLFRNNEKMVSIGNTFWDEAERHGLAGIVGELRNNRLHTPDGHSFTNFSCCSYLDLDQHPKIIDGAIAALRRFGVLDHCITRARVQIPACQCCALGCASADRLRPPDRWPQASDGL